LGLVLGVLPGSDSSLSGPARTTILVFSAAILAWVFTDVDDTYVALGAATALVLAGVLSTDELFATLGDDTVWLLLAAFVIAAGVTSSGLATRAAAWIIAGASTPHQLVHLLTAALVVTTFAVPSTSGRAALALPVLVGLARVLRGHPQLVRALALVFPTVILLSAVGSLLGAGAHLVTSQVVATATGEGFDFAGWLTLGLPLAVVASHLGAELVLLMFTDREQRSVRLSVRPEDFEAGSPTPVTGPFTVAESRASLLLAAVVLLWCTESLHGVHPAIVALGGALVATSPRYGATSLKAALATVPWSLLLFMAATLALGTALTSSGAAQWLAQGLFGGLVEGSATVFIVVVVLISTAAHLVVQSRSARSSVLVPIVVALSPAVGVDPAAAAFASTAAAGFCHTMPSSAKPVAIFAKVEGVETYTPADLLRLSVVLAPLSAALVLLFSFAVWPVLGMPLTP
ncbi:MAG TPA: SLC13 family permease, partial [Actinomycetales bacterium]